MHVLTMYYTSMVMTQIAIANAQMPNCVAILVKGQSISSIPRIEHILLVCNGVRN